MAYDENSLIFQTQIVSMEEAKDKLETLDISDKTETQVIVPDCEDSEDSFHSINSEEEESLQDTQSRYVGLNSGCTNVCIF